MKVCSVFFILEIEVWSLIMFKCSHRFKAVEAKVMERKIIPQNPWNCVNFKLRSCYAINFDVEENAKERLNPRKVIHQVPSTDIRGFQIDNCVFQSDLDFTNLKSQVYNQAKYSINYCLFLEVSMSNLQNWGYFGKDCGIVSEIPQKRTVNIACL